MHESQWHGVADEVRKLCARPEYNVTGEIKWRYFGAENTDEDNSVAHLDQDQRESFRRALFEIITQRKSIRIIACAADTLAAYRTRYVNTKDDLYHFTYKPVSERFQYHLQDVSRTIGERQLGIVIADPRGKSQDEALRLHHQGLVENPGDFTSKYANFVETIFFTPSHLSPGIQLADMVAGAIGRALNAKDLTYAKMIKTAFRHSPDGRINGFGFAKFPRAGWGVPSGGGAKPPDAIATSPTPTK